VHVIRAHGNVSALVSAEFFENTTIMIPIRTRMDLHHHAVFNAHLRHFGQHLAADNSASSGVMLPESAFASKDSH